MSSSRIGWRRVFCAISVATPRRANTSKSTTAYPYCSRICTRTQVLQQLVTLRPLPNNYSVRFLSVFINSCVLTRKRFSSAAAVPLRSNSFVYYPWRLTRYSLTRSSQVVVCCITWSGAWCWSAPMTSCRMTYDRWAAFRCCWRFYSECTCTLHNI